MLQYFTFRGSVDDYWPYNITVTDNMSVAAGNPTQWTFTLQRVTGGSGNGKVLGTAGNSNEFTVEDVGPITRIV